MATDLNSSRRPITHAVVLLMLLLSACATQSLGRGPAPLPVNLADRTGEAVDRLLGSLSPPLGTSTTILVASFVDLNDTSVSTKLGRLISEQTAEHLIQRGYRVQEPRLTSDVGIKDDGVYILPRGPNEGIRDGKLNTSVIMAGTTTSVGGITYINFRLIRNGDGISLAATDIALPDRLAR